ncbi:hypothetical protein D3C72_1332430 [compost metagenome]
MFFQLAQAAAFDFAGGQVNGVGQVASAEIITAAGIHHNGIFFINQSGGFTTGDLFHLGETALEGHDDHRNQQGDPGQAQYGMLANELHNFLQHGV